jgi:hypothetical protein
MASPLSTLSGALLVLGFACAVTLPAGPADAAKKKYSQSKNSSGKPLRGVIKKRGGYSYRSTDTTSSRDWRFIDPSYSRQTPGGPFDNGFFFDSGMGPNGGDSPYQQ